MNSTNSSNYLETAKACGLIALIGVGVSFAIFIVLGATMWSAPDSATKNTPGIVFAVGAVLSFVAGVAMYVRHVMTDTGAKTIRTQAEAHQITAAAGKDIAYANSVNRLNGAQYRPAPQLPAHKPVALKAGDRVIDGDLFKTEPQARPRPVITNWQAPLSAQAAQAAQDDDGLIQPTFVRVAQKQKIELPIETVDEKRARVLQLAMMIFAKCRMRNPSRTYVESRLGAAGATNALMKSAGDYTAAMNELERQGRAWRDRDSRTSPWLWVDERAGEPVDLG